MSSDSAQIFIAPTSAERLDRESASPGPAYDRIKRAMDFTLSLVALVGLLPLFLIVAITIRLEGPGPILYSQERVGLNRRQRIVPSRGASERRRQEGYGRRFAILKFRSMIPDAEKHTGAVWALDHDPRVTRVGRILRSAHIDELPQLVNVLRGEMSLVGPRPERLQLVRLMVERNPEYPLRCHVLPGITGLAQIKNGYSGSFEAAARKLESDLRYIRGRSLLLDLGILLATIAYLVRNNGEGHHLARSEAGQLEPIPDVAPRHPSRTAGSGPGPWRREAAPAGSGRTDLKTTAI